MIIFYAAKQYLNFSCVFNSCIIITCYYLWEIEKSQTKSKKQSNKKDPTLNKAQNPTMLEKMSAWFFNYWVK